MNKGTALGYQGNSIKAFIQEITTFQSTAATASNPQSAPAGSCGIYDVVGKVPGLKRIEVLLK